MRNIPIPVDTSKLTFVCVADPRPRVLNQETGEVKTDKAGQTVYEVAVSVTDDAGRIELLRLGVSGEPSVTIGTRVRPVDLVGYVWEMKREDGTNRWGVSYRAASVLPAPADGDAIV